MRSNEHALYDGNYSYYIRQVEAERESAAMAAGAEKRPKAAKGGKTPRGGGQDAAAAVEKPQRTRFHKLRLEELEQLIIDLETRLMGCTSGSAEPGCITTQPAFLNCARNLTQCRPTGRGRAEWNVRGAGNPAARQLPDARQRTRRRQLSIRKQPPDGGLGGAASVWSVLRGCVRLVRAARIKRGRARARVSVPLLFQQWPELRTSASRGRFAMRPSIAGHWSLVRSGC